MVSPWPDARVGVCNGLFSAHSGVLPFVCQSRFQVGQKRSWSIWSFIHVLIVSNISWFAYSASKISFKPLEFFLLAALAVLRKRVMPILTTKVLEHRMLRDSATALACTVIAFFKAKNVVINLSRSCPQAVNALMAGAVARSAVRYL